MIILGYTGIRCEIGPTCTATQITDCAAIISNGIPRNSFK